MTVVVPFVDGEGVGTIDEAQLVIFALGATMLARSPDGRWLELGPGDVWLAVDPGVARGRLACWADGSAPVVAEGPLLGLVCRLALDAWFPEQSESAALLEAIRRLGS